MTEHADHRFSATLSGRDLALIGCLRALADFSQRNLSRESREETDCRAAGQKVTFGFSGAVLSCPSVSEFEGVSVLNCEA
jgi:hypothetical protein